ncbi:peptide methionine sulfoxide reductase [Capsaspora owczarzaki ATCC 30864]|uniref:peptide-methionine (S)-S-oxide reductase n=2 Tax=Capsaspora owczarzaki (strain ATCC 30864) TaxID=595528 RepID=A0A0D2X1T4_CAPO3|nr:peptide methionine sulfoxide reductase [Capsaspora owczarzaki ATCC 30864]
MSAIPPTAQTAYVAAGCFWGVQQLFAETPGVVDTAVGYMNGKTQNPTYKQVCYNETGHAEAVKIVFDPARVSYDALLKVFWDHHDPTTLNRQGPDHGTQYRSAIFYVDNAQKDAALASREAEQKQWSKPISTEVTAADVFYPAEDYHQHYFAKNGGGACHRVVRKS